MARRTRTLSNGARRVSKPRYVRASDGTVRSCGPRLVSYAIQDASFAAIGV